MARVTVKVTKLTGETGLRRPGSCYLECPDKAARLEAMGLVEIIKELKTPIETKELKLKRTTKKK